MKTSRQQRIRLIKLIARILVLLLSLWILYREFILKEKFQELLSWWTGEADRTLWRWFFLSAGLVFINWGIETRKWQYLVRRYEQMPFYKAYASVLAGVFVSFFTPNRVGEFAGRMLYVPAKKKIAVAVAAVVGSMGQLLCTLLGGFVALVTYFVGSLSLSTAHSVIILTAAFIAATAVLYFFFRIGELKHILLKIKPLRRFERQLDVFDHVSAKDLLLVIYFSSLRYMVFMLQYYLMLQAFEVDITFATACMSIAMLYFVQAVIPTFAVSELTTRVSLIALFDQSTAGFTHATYCIWLINILFPSLAGAAVILVKNPRDVDRLD